MSFNMTEEEWDSVVKVHLKGHFAPARFAGAVLAPEEQGHRRVGQRQDREHRVGVGPLRQRRPGQLRGGQGRHRIDDHRARPRARALRRAGQLHRPRRAHPPHRGPDGRRRATRSSQQKLAPSNIAAGVCWLASDLSDGRQRPGAEDPGRARPDRPGLAPVSQITSDQDVDDRVHRRAAATRCSPRPTPASRRSSSTSPTPPADPGGCVRSTPTLGAWVRGRIVRRCRWAVGPVLLAEHALEDLAVGLAGQLVDELEARRHLEVGEPLAAERRAARRASPGSRASTTAMSCSPSRSSGTPNTAQSTTAGCVYSTSSISRG